MSNTTIYYFSATGNSLAVARNLAEVLDVGDPISVPGSLINKDPYINARGAKAVGFVFPVQRATIPEMLRGFIQSMPVDPNCYYFAVSTYSLFGSNEFWDIDELLTAAGAQLNYAAGIRMMGNVGIRQPSQEIIERRHEQMERQIDEIATAVAYRQENYFPRANKFLGKAVSIFTDMRRKNIVFHIDKRCKKCGICALVCPAQNVQLSTEEGESAGPMRSDKCEACLACVHWCPAAAISTSRRKHARYHNPRVSPEELNTKIPLGTGAVSVGARKSEAGNGNGDSNVKLDEELAAALREDLITPKDIDSWLNETKQVDTPTSNTSRSKSTTSPESAMLDEEIARALADLES